MNKTGIPALGELPVQLTDTHTPTHVYTQIRNSDPLEAYLGTHKHINSLLASSSHTT